MLKIPLVCKTGRSVIAVWLLSSCIHGENTCGLHNWVRPFLRARRCFERMSGKKSETCQKTRLPVSKTCKRPPWTTTPSCAGPLYHWHLKKRPTRNRSDPRVLYLGHQTRSASSSSSPPLALVGCYRWADSVTFSSDDDLAPVNWFLSVLSGYCSRSCVISLQFAATQLRVDNKTHLDTVSGVINHFRLLKTLNVECFTFHQTQQCFTLNSLLVSLIYSFRLLLNIQNPALDFLSILSLPF